MSTQKKTNHYIITFDADGDEVVWIQHPDRSVRVSALNPGDIEDSKIPLIDLRHP